MFDLNKRQVNILNKMPEEMGISSSDIFKLLNENFSLITIKRDLDYLVEIKYLERNGKGRSTKYKKTICGLLFMPIDASSYNKVEPDVRVGNNTFNFSLFEKFPLNIFSEEEKKILDSSTKKYKERIKKINSIVQNKELERFVIELSWKSSKIEGNTYTLLDTERLIREGVRAKGHNKDEATMILNHKKALDFILENIDVLRRKGINNSFVEKVHELLTFELGVSRGVRSGLIGIIGTKYKPLDNKFQISEALNYLYKKVNEMEDPYSKALTLLVGISYIQPFEDGNKRASRLLCNAILLANGCAPLSYRSVDENNYRESILVFYEKNSLMPMKEIFVTQYLFSADNYLVK